MTYPNSVMRPRNVGSTGGSAAIGRPGGAWVPPGPAANDNFPRMPRPANDNFPRPNPPAPRPGPRLPRAIARIGRRLPALGLAIAGYQIWQSYQPGEQTEPSVVFPPGWRYHNCFPNRPPTQFLQNRHLSCVASVVRVDGHENWAGQPLTNRRIMGLYQNESTGFDIFGAVKEFWHKDDLNAADPVVTPGRASPARLPEITPQVAPQLWPLAMPIAVPVPVLKPLPLWDPRYEPILPEGRRSGQPSNRPSTGSNYKLPRRPGRKTKEVKIKATVPMLAEALLGTVTEMIDTVGAIYEALPFYLKIQLSRKYGKYEYRSSGGWTYRRFQWGGLSPQQKMAEVVKHADKLDWEKAMSNLLDNEILDTLYGAWGQAVGEATQTVTPTRPVSPEYGGWLIRELHQDAENLANSEPGDDDWEASRWFTGVF